MTEAGFILLKADKVKDVYVFENKEVTDLDLDDMVTLRSDILSFSGKKSPF